MYRFIKRIFDIAASLLALIVLSPVWLVAIIGILVSDPGPVFYLANRVGKDDHVFKMYKFRSMRVDNSANEKSLRPDQDRIFPFGRFIRAAKIDELPQLLNVLKADMSVIGPRPASVDQVIITRAGENAAISQLEPGLSGPSALYDYVFGDEITDEDEYERLVLPTRLKLDLYYLQARSVAYDIKMIWWTVLTILVPGQRKRILNELLESAASMSYEDSDSQSILLSGTVSDK